MKPILILCAEFNSKITKSLLSGVEFEFANAAIAKNNYQVEWVPGAFELPTAAAIALEKNTYSAVICLGAVIKGETPHFEVVAFNCAQRVSELGVQYKTPVIFGVLTTNTTHQALVRSGLAGDDSQNSGIYYGRAALKMIELQQRFKEVKS